MKADLAATLEGFRTDMASFREDAERRDKEAAVRDRENQRWVVGLVLGTAVLVIAVLGILIRWPAPPV